MAFSRPTIPLWLISALTLSRRTSPNPFSTALPQGTSCVFHYPNILSPKHLKANWPALFSGKLVLFAWSGRMWRTAKCTCGLTVAPVAMRVKVPLSAWKSLRNGAGVILDFPCSGCEPDFLVGLVATPNRCKQWVGNQGQKKTASTAKVPGSFHPFYSL